MNKILKLFDKNLQSPPIWLMRQAGRYMPEYMKVKKKHPDFFTMCRDIDAVCDITLQPIKKFNLDAAIIFSDILIILECLNIKVKFVPNTGPIVDKFNIDKFKEIKTEEIDYNKVKPVYEAIYKLKKELKVLNKPLIGFAAAPWTLATYLIEGQLTKDHVKIREFAYKKKDDFKKIVEILSGLITSHLENQILHGVDIIQIFDTHAHNMDNFLYEVFFTKEIKKICKHIKEKHPNVPISLFSKNSQVLHKELYKYIDCISFSSHINMKQYLDIIPSNICFQGNLDPMRLVVGGESMVEATNNILNDMINKDFVFNLGHGILQQTPVENVQLLVETVKKFKR